MICFLFVFFYLLSASSDSRQSKDLDVVTLQLDDLRWVLYAGKNKWNCFINSTDYLMQVHNNAKDSNVGSFMWKTSLVLLTPSHEKVRLGYFQWKSIKNNTNFNQFQNGPTINIL